MTNWEDDLAELGREVFTRLQRIFRSMLGQDAGTAPVQAAEHAGAPEITAPAESSLPPEPAPTSIPPAP